jgi:hypothetical protein
MAYSSFTVKQVEQQFNLQIITDSFLPVIPPLAPIWQIFYSGCRL